MTVATLQDVTDSKYRKGLICATPEMSIGDVLAALRQHKITAVAVCHDIDIDRGDFYQLTAYGEIKRVRTRY